MDRISAYLKDGKPTYCYNFLGLQEYKVAAPAALPAGKATIRMNFDYDGGGAGKGQQRQRQQDSDHGTGRLRADKACH